MKKGFTMIELIFVIVILGILASVAIPRLAGTREDAEISAAVANLRTLVGDANVYYVTKGSFGATTKWQEFTSVPLVDADNAAVGTATGGTTNATAHLKVNGENCIGLYLVEKDTATNKPAHIVFTKESPAGNTVCTNVQAAPSVKAYLDSTLPGDTTAGKMPIGSTAKIY
ncbi:type II secretion system protein [Campylobacter sp. 50012-21]|uniref:type II secretion system protein n=1 Tax=Campylobacter magnus TaxID=3026462 RepID=UPI002360CF5F|nr:type II secretion system protein [Campylobacter magnus]MDD0845990.1 type II secretion system protein [Campylobacter magnus]